MMMLMRSMRMRLRMSLRSCFCTIAGPPQAMRHDYTRRAVVPGRDRVDPLTGGGCRRDIVFVAFVTGGVLLCAREIRISVVTTRSLSFISQCTTRTPPSLPATATHLFVSFRTQSAFLPPGTLELFFANTFTEPRRS